MQGQLRGRSRGEFDPMTAFDQNNQDVDSQQNAERIYNGIPFEQYKADLAEKEAKHQAELAEKQAEILGLSVSAAVDRTNAKNEIAILEKELAEVRRQQGNEKDSYESFVKERVLRIERLDQLEDQLPSNLIKDAQEALTDSDNDRADAIFAQIEEMADPHIAAAAEVAYQRGGLAEDGIIYPEAFKHYRRAVELSPCNPEYLSKAGLMAGVLVDLSNEIDWNERALEIYLQRQGEDGLKVAATRNNLGSAWSRKGDYDKAIGYYEKALASGLQIFGEDHPNVATARNNLGSAWQSKGDYDRAIGYFEQALAGHFKTVGEDHPEVVTTLNNLGLAWNSRGDYDKAIGYIERALASGLDVFGEDHPNVATARNNLGLAWNSKGNYDKAIGYYEQALTSGL